ncbi:serine hydrolase domain-containing protein [Pantoea sp. S-LA4]
MTAFTDQLSRLLDDLTREAFPAISIAIGKGDRLIWQYAAGYADIRNRVENSPDTAFGIGSITKVFIAVIILQLTEQRQIQLDDRLSDWLEETSLSGIANAKAATIRQLLSHYAGIASWEDQPAWIQAARGKHLIANRFWLPEASLDYIRDQPPLSLPDENFHYSNSHFTLLGMLIERVTGHRLQDELDQRIFRPLALNATRLDGFSPTQPQKVAARYHRCNADFIRNAGIAASFQPEHNAILNVSSASLSVEWAAGGIVSTAGELMAFILALKNGALLNRQSLRDMQRWRAAGEAQMGLSLFRTDSAYGPAIGHGGNVLGYSACAWWFEQTDCAVAIVTNVGSMHAGADAHCASRLFRDSDIVKLAHAISGR